MATARQIAANKSNATRSTGPASDSGRAAAAGNSLKHGLTARRLTPDGLAELVARRRDEWRGGYDLRTAEEQWVFDLLVLSSVQLDACRAQEPVLGSHLARRAELCWDEDRNLAVEGLAARLPRDPAVVVRKLEATRHGNGWLVGHWIVLGEGLRDGRDWTEAEFARAFDLLGLSAERREVLAAVADREWCRRVVGEELRRLTGPVRDGLVELDAAERGMAEEGIPLEVPPALKRLRRYAAEALRRYRWAREQLKRAEAPAAAGAATPPATYPPEPAPSWASPAEERDFEAILRERSPGAETEAEAEFEAEAEAEAEQAPAPAAAAESKPSLLEPWRMSDAVPDRALSRRQRRAAKKRRRGR